MSDQRRCQLVRFVRFVRFGHESDAGHTTSRAKTLSSPFAGGGWEGGALLVCKDITPARDGTVRPPDGPGLDAKIDFALIERKKTSVLS